MASERWQGKIALVTGATSGIGRATAFALARIGMNVAIAGRRTDRLDEVAAQLRFLDVEALPIPVDQTAPGATEHLFATLRSSWSSADVLVNNAGVTGGRWVLDGGREQYDQCMSLNLDASVACLKEAVRDMRAKNSGAVITISSLTAHRTVAMETSATYAASKVALRTIVDGIRMELANEGSAVKVAMISPGRVASEFQAGGSSAPRRNALSPTDVAAAAIYILGAPPDVQICDILLRPIGQVA